MAEPPARSPLVAAIDCGSNSTRLLIARTDGSGVTALARRTTITRLGAGVDATGRLSEAAVTRVTDVLADYARQWRDADVGTVALTATSAVRDAADAETFLGAVRHVAGATPVVLTGAQEAALTFAGATAGVQGRRVVCDIGGGSTELIVGDGAVERWVSLQLGSVRLRERHLHDDPPSAAQYGALSADIDAALAAAPDAFAAIVGQPMLAVAGTALTVAAIARGSLDPDVDLVDGAVLSTAEVAQVVEDLAWMPANARSAYPPVVPGREDVIVAGATLLARVLAHFGHPAVEVRVADLLDGVAARAAAGTWPPGTRAVPRRGAVGDQPGPGDGAT